MPRFLDLVCPCGAEVADLFVMRVPSRIVHLECGQEMELVYRLRSQDTAWSDKDSVVVFRKPDGTYSYPARNDKPTPRGCERIQLKSLGELRAFEKRAGVRSEISEFDKGSGRGFDDAPAQRGLPERERYELFRKATQGIL